MQGPPLCPPGQGRPGVLMQMIQDELTCSCREAWSRLQPVAPCHPQSPTAPCGIALWLPPLLLPGAVVHSGNSKPLSRTAVLWQYWEAGPSANNAPVPLSPSSATWCSGHVLVSDGDKGSNGKASGWRRHWELQRELAEHWRGVSPLSPFPRPALWLSSHQPTPVNPVRWKGASMSFWICLPGALRQAAGGLSSPALIWRRNLSFISLPPGAYIHPQAQEITRRNHGIFLMKTVISAWVSCNSASGFSAAF